MRIEISKQAGIDIIEARHWYNEQQKGLGNRFAKEVNEVLESIVRNPWFAGIRYQNVRTPACKSFPFSVHYEIDEAAKVIRIASVFHHSRKPFWLPDVSDIEE